MKLYVDGSCLGNGLVKPAPGGWAALNPDTLERWSGYGLDSTNQQAELQAIALAVEVAPPGIELHIYTDSAFSIAAIMGRIKIQDKLLKPILVRCWQLAEEKDIKPVLHKNKGKRSRPAIAVDMLAKQASKYAQNLLREKI